jgi:hypothetical protein
MRLSVARVVMKKNHVLKSVFIHSVIKTMVGIQKTNALNYGTPIMEK